MALIRWEPFGRQLSPWESFEALRRRMDRLFDDFTRRDEEVGSSWLPSVDLSENSDSFLIKADVPGMDKKDIKITMQDNVLNISGEKKQEKEEKDRNYHLIERSYGQFSRSFTLPTKVDSDKIKAEFKNGVLEIVIPKAPEAKAREIEIQVK
jgi:HSP20 family protein